MQKIDFVNSQQPAINDTNLNLMQTYIETAIQGAVSGDTLPIGAIMPFGGGTIPDDYLLCDGSAVSRTTYAQLFSVIGTSFGVGDGSTTFNVPNMKGKVPVGYDSTQTEFNSLGKTGGEKKHTLTISEMPQHDHNVQKSSDIDRLVLMAKAQNKYGGADNGTGSGDWEWNYGVPKQGGGSSHNNLQPYNTTNYIIKAFQAAGTVASVLNVHSTSTTNIYSAGYINNGVTGAQVYAPVTPSKDDTISLSSSFASGNYIEIIYGRFRVGSSDIAWQSTGKLPYTDGMTINLQCIYAAGGAEPTAESNSKLVIISGNSLTTSTKINDNIAIAKIIKYNAI